MKLIFRDAYPNTIALRCDGDIGGVNLRRKGVAIRPSLFHGQTIIVIDISNLRETMEAIREVLGT